MRQAERTDDRFGQLSPDREVRELAENRPDVIIRYDRNLCHTCVNTAGIGVSGPPGEETAQRTDRQLQMPEETASRIRDAVQTVFAGGPPECFEVSLSSSGGEEGIFDCRFTPEFSADGSIQSVLAVARDVTRRREAEKRLSAREELLKALLNASHESMLLMDRQGKLIALNDTAASRLGGTPEELVGQNAYELVGSDVARRRKPFVQTAIRSRAPVFFEDERGGRIFSHRVYPVVDPEGRVDQLAVHARDVTGARQAQEAVRRSEEHLRLVVEGGGLGVWDSDLVSGETLWNRKLYDLLGMDPGQEPVSLDVFVNHIHEADRRRIQDSVQKWIEDGIWFQDEFRIVREDGQVRWLASAGRVYRDQAGQPVRMAGVNYDITGKKHLEHELQKSREELEDKVKERTAELRRSVEALRSEIRKRRQTEAALAASERMYSALVETSPDIIYTLDGDGNFTFVGGACEPLLGFRPEELIGRHITVLTPSEQGATENQHFRKRQAGIRATQSFESRLYTKGGEAREFDFHHIPVERHALGPFDQPISSKKKRLPGTYGVARDITERKQAERELRRSEERFRVLFDSNPIETVVVDTRGKVTSFNRAKAESGFRIPQIGDRMYQDYAGGHAADMRGALMECINEKRPREFSELRYGDRYLDVRMSPFEGGAIITSVDETKRKEFEASLRESENRFRQMAETIPMAFWMRSPDLKELRYLSPAFERIYGISLEEAYGNPRAWLGAIHPEDREQVINKFRPYGGTNIEVEYRILRPDGSMKWVRDCSFPVTDEGGRIRAVTGFGQDITWAKEAQSRLRELSSRLLHAQEEERRRISADLHDGIGQALPALKLMVGSIQRRLRRDQETIRNDCREIAGYINETIENVRRMSRDLSPTVLEDLGISATLKWLVEDLANRLDVRVTTDLPDLEDCFSREAQIVIYRIFQEALNNIAKHARAGAVSVSGHHQGNRMHFEIADNGRGFDPEEVWGRTGVEKGLGLSTMAERARLLGGTCDIRSGPNQGTRVHFVIPKDPEE